MLEFLKKSTFRANDVFFRALNILRKHYISVAGLCFMLFIVSALSTYLAMYLEELVGTPIKVILLILFIVTFFGLQLVLIKRAVLLSHGVFHTKLIEYFPSGKQFFNFLLGLVFYYLLQGVVPYAIGILCFPLVYLDLDISFIANDVVSTVSYIITSLLLLRITFFPFFILERNINFFQAVKLSIAFTKGNYMTILTMFFLLGVSSLIAYVLFKFGYWYIAMFFAGISVFIIIPLVSIVMAIAYVDMIKEYKGSDNPELFKNIL